MAIDVKTLNGLAFSSCKTRNGIAVASIKSINGVDTTAGGGGFAPNDITGNLLWQDPNAEVGADGSAIATAADYSGTSNTGTRNAGSGITLKHNAINGRKSYVFNDAGFTLANTNDLTEWTYATIVKITTSGLHLLVGADASSFFDTQGGAIHFSDNGSIGRVEYSGAWYSIVITNSGTVRKLYINGAQSASPVSISSPTQEFNNTFGFSPYGFVGEGASAALWDHVLTEEELEGYHQWVFDEFALVPHKLIVCVGDSLTGGTGGTPYPTQLLAGYAANEWDVVNVGVAGRTVADMVSAFAADVSAYANALRPEQAAVMWGGTNDVNAGESAATVEARIDSWCALARAEGLSIILGTIIARSDFDAGEVTIQGTLNTWLRGAGPDCDGVADFQANAAFDDQADTANATYYSDGIHLTTTGYGVIKGIAETAINAL
jgi:lysophospholipase L1-like esterase